MSKDSFLDLKCCDCDEIFDEASKLLAHFALHVVESEGEKIKILLKNDKNGGCDAPGDSYNKVLPDLHPINKWGKSVKNESYEGVDQLDPTDFCTVSIESPLRKDLKIKKYHCTVCLKSFGWSTDLKRHLLIHSGLRPFKCDKCNATFTRNFLLKNHLLKKHKMEISKNLPKLNPIKMRTEFKDGFVEKGILMQ